MHDLVESSMKPIVICTACTPMDNNPLIDTSSSNKSLAFSTSSKGIVNNACSNHSRCRFIKQGTTICCFNHNVHRFCSLQKSSKLFVLSHNAYKWSCQILNTNPTVVAWQLCHCNWMQMMMPTTLKLGGTSQLSLYDHYHWSGLPRRLLYRTD